MLKRARLQRRRSNRDTERFSLIYHSNKPGTPRSNLDKFAFSVPNIDDTCPRLLSYYTFTLRRSPGYAKSSLSANGDLCNFLPRATAWFFSPHS